MTPPRYPEQPNPKMGEIWWIALDPTIGSEIKKTRPCLVIQTNALHSLPTRIVVPLTGWKKKHEERPWSVLIEATAHNGLQKESAADALQIRAVALERFRSRLGTVSPITLEKVQAAVALCLDMQIQG